MCSLFPTVKPIPYSADGEQCHGGLDALEEDDEDGNDNVMLFWSGCHKRGPGHFVKNNACWFSLCKTVILH